MNGSLLRLICPCIAPVKIEGDAMRSLATYMTGGGPLSRSTVQVSGAGTMRVCHPEGSFNNTPVRYTAKNARGKLFVISLMCCFPAYLARWAWSWMICPSYSLSDTETQWLYIRFQNYLSSFAKLFGAASALSSQHFLSCCSALIQKQPY